MPITGKELERFIDGSSAIGATHLDHLGRALRAAGLMPTGGRGITAPKLDAVSVTNFLIAVGIADTPLMSAQKVPAYRMARASWSGITNSDGSQPPSEAFEGCETLGEAIDTLLTQRSLMPKLSAVEVIHEWPRAEIVMKGGRKFYYGAADISDLPSVGAVRSIRRKTVIPVSIISWFALRLETDSVTSGWIIDDQPPESGAPHTPRSRQPA